LFADDFHILFVCLLNSLNLGLNFADFSESIIRVPLHFSLWFELSDLSGNFIVFLFILSNSLLLFEFLLHFSHFSIGLLNIFL
jgi:hypothetical protein